MLALSGTASCQQAPGWASSFVRPQHCSQGVYLELLICFHKHEHINWLLWLQSPSSQCWDFMSLPIPNVKKSLFPHLLSTVVRMEKQLETGKRERTSEPAAGDRHPLPPPPLCKAAA